MNENSKHPLFTVHEIVMAIEVALFIVGAFLVILTINHFGPLAGGAALGLVVVAFVAVEAKARSVERSIKRK